MKTRKRLLVGALVLAVMLTLILGIVACKPTPEPPQFVPQGEEAVYYCDTSTGENTIELKNGHFILSIAGDNKTGTYEYELEKKEIAFTFSDGSIQRGTLDLTKGELGIRYADVRYTLIKKVNYTVTFETNGGSAVASVTAVNGRTIVKPADPSKNGYVFAGWYADAGLTKAFNFKSDKITANTTLYARFVEQQDGANEFSVNLVNNGQVVETRKTINGSLYNLPELKETGKTFLGWWISDSNNADKLTRQYFDTEVIQQNTSLYAVWEGDVPAVSVFSDRIEWTDVGANSYTYSILSAKTQEVVTGSQVTSNSVAVDFSEQSAGEYIISVSVNNKTAVAYYNNKTLAQVSLFEVNGNDLIFNKVANATEYTITVICGDPTHNHVNESLGTSTTYNFANCQIAKDGYKFTVTAKAKGMVSSVSETFEFNRSLGEVKNITRNNDETVSWDAVEGATTYLVKITNGQNVEEKTVYTNSVDVGMYRGNVTVEVTPVAFGYNATAQQISYVNNRLVAPSNIRVNMSTITWDAVEGAVSYLVKIGDKEYVVYENSLTMDETYYVPGQVEYVISIKAVASNSADSSMFSEEFRAQYGVMGSTIKYNNNVLSWDAVFGAVKYVITINAGEETETVIEVTDGSLSATIVWPRAGVNTISVYSVDKDGVKSSAVSTQVTTYAITFVVNDNILPVETIYKAIGDEYVLPETIGLGLSFIGWYDREDFTNGKKLDNTGIFAGEFTVYAGWTSDKYTVTLDLGGEGTLGDQATSAEVFYGERYTLPVPTTDNTSLAFAGWYTEPNGAGTKYTDEKGASIGGYPQATGRILYASWVQVFEFTVIYNEKTNDYDSVSIQAGPGIAYVTDLVVPVSYYGTLTYLETYQDEVGNQAVREITETKNWIVTTIAGNAFKSATTIVTAKIPNTVTYIPLIGEGSYYSPSAFASCSKLESVMIYDANNPQREINNSNGAIYWSQDGVVYYNDSSTASTEVACYPFAKADATYVMPYGVTSIPQYGLRGAKFVSVFLPSSITKVNKAAFYSCGNLISIEFMEPQEGEVAGNGLTLAYGTTTNAAFYSCSKLESITFPLRLKTFEQNSVQSCSKLAIIRVGNDESKFGDNYSSITYKDDTGKIIGSAITDRSKTKIIYIPRGYIGQEITDENGEVIHNRIIIPNGIETIGEYALGGTSSSYASKVTQVYISGTVTTIEPYAFAYCQSLTSVVFEGQKDDPDLTIDSFAFYYCNKIETITLPANLTTINEYAFASTSKLTTVYVNADRDTVDYKAGAFASVSTTGAGYGTYYVVSLYIGDNCPDIAISPVFGNTTLANIYVGEKNNFYKSSADGVLFNRAETRILYFPMGRTGSYTIPATVTEIEAETFRERDKLESVIIHANVKTIGTNAFFGCGALTSVIFEKTPSGQAQTELTIADGAFYNVDYITSIEIPARTVAIGEQAFRDCARLYKITFEDTPAGQNEKELKIGRYAFAATTSSNFKSIQLPNRLTEIGDLAFYGCSYLETINIPANVSKMGYYENRVVNVHSVNSKGETTTTAGVKKDILVSMSVFYNCYRLKEINVDPANKYFASVDGVLYGKEYLAVQVTNYLPYSTSTTNPTQYFTIMDSEYYDRTDDTLKVLLVCPTGNSGVDGSITIPNTIMGIWYNAFYYNGNPNYHDDEVGITSVSFTKDYIENARNNELYVGEQVFYQCKKLETVSLPRGISSIPEYFFYYCELLQEITIPNTVASIEIRAFSYCKSLHTINFEDASPDEEVVGFVLQAGNTAASAFYECGSLKHIELPERTVSIEKYAFMASSIEEISLPSTLKDIKSYALTQYSSSSSKVLTIKKVLFPNGIADDLKIWDYACYMNSALEEIQLPEGIVGIGYKAFQGCTSLTSVVLPSTLTELGEYYSSTTSTLTGYVFAEATSLASVTFAGAKTRSATTAQIKSIPDYCFQKCYALTSFEIPASVETVGKYAFSNCRELTSITFEEDENNVSKLEEVLQNAFEKTMITSFSFPESSASKLTLGTEIFKACSELKEVYLSANIAIISGVFKGCSSIEKITVSPNNVNFKAYEPADGKPLPILVSTNNESIKFVYGTLEDTFEIPEGFIAIDDNAFKGQTELKKVVFPTSLNRIGQYAFSGCASLETVEFPRLTTLTTIDKYAFENTTSLMDVVFPSNPDLTIGQYAFSHSGVTNISFNGLVKKIDTYAFEYTERLVNASFPDAPDLTVGNYAFRYSGLKSFEFEGDIKTLGTYTFFHCEQMEQVKGWPKSVTTIPGYTFQFCISLTSFTIPNTVTAIGNYVFASTAAFGAVPIREITIPSTVKTIGTYMFQYNDKLESVTFEENSNITALGNYMFSYCASLTEVDLSPLPNLNFLGQYTFQYTGITEFTVPKKVTKLNNTATATTAGVCGLFRGCEQLTTVELHDDITIIGNMVFQDCINLTTVTAGDHSEDATPFVGAELPAKCKLTGTYVFSNCASLTKIDATRASGVLTTLGNYMLEETVIEEFCIPKSVTSSGTNLFLNSMVKRVTFEEGSKLKAFGQYSFRYCTQLEEVDFTNAPDINFLGTYAFQGCTSLEEFTLPAKVVVLGTSATACATNSSAYTFDGCTSLTTVNLNNCTKIGGYAFRGCTSLTTVEGLDRVEIYGQYAFRGCGAIIENEDGTVTKTGLKKVTVGANVKSATTTAAQPYGPGVFAECVALEEVVIEQSSTTFFGQINNTTYSLGTTGLLYGMFNACVSLTTVTIPANIDTITIYTFSQCTSLTDISFLYDSDIEIIHKGAFYQSGITEVDLSNFDDMTIIKQCSFMECHQLTKVTLPAKLKTIETEAFRYSDKITGITIPATVTSIGNHAFGGCSSIKAFDVASGNSTYRTGVSGEIINSNDQVVAIPSGFEGVFTFTAGTVPGEYCMSGASKITNVILPDGITMLANYAFSYFQGESITIPSTVTRIGNYCFSYTDNLKKMVIPATVEKLGTNLFDYSGVEEVIIENPDVMFTSNGTSVASYTYLCNYTDNLKKLVLPEGMTTLPAQIISNLTGADFEFHIPSTVTKLPTYYVIFSCKSCIMDVTVPEGITDLSYLFYYSSSATSEETIAPLRNYMEKFVVPSTVKKVGNYVFSMFEFGEFDWNGAKVEELGYNVFYGTKYDGEIRLPETLKKMGYKTFGAANIGKVYIPGNIEEIGGTLYDHSGSSHYEDSTFYYATIGEVEYGYGTTCLNEKLSGSYGPFYYSRYIGKVVLPETYSVVGYGDFAYFMYQNQDDLYYPQLVIPEKVKEIGYYGFYNAKIKNLYILGQINSINGSYAFAYWGYYDVAQTIYFTMNQSLAMECHNGAFTYTAFKADMVFDFDGEIPEFQWPTPEEDSGETTN